MDPDFDFEKNARPEFTTFDDLNPNRTPEKNKEKVLKFKEEIMEKLYIAQIMARKLTHDLLINP